MKKYVLEVGFEPSYYVGFTVEERKLYPTYEEAKAEYDRILQDNYDEEDLEDEEFVQECADNVNPDMKYLDTWYDEESDIYLGILEVEEVVK